MRSRLVRCTAPIAAAAALLTASSILLSTSKTGFTEHDKAYYADPAALNFVRPGLTSKSSAPPSSSDGTITAKVRFTDSQGAGLDISGVTSSGAVSAGNPGMIAAVMPQGQNQFMAYTTRSQMSTLTGNSAIQAANDAGGRWQQTADGEYTYTFATKAPADRDMNAVHAIGIYAARDLTAFDVGEQLDDDVYYFIPASGQQVPNPRDEIRTATCQKCHGPNMHFHGETGRSSVQMCDLCHQPQITDPDTGNTVDMKVFVHKIHMGANLPSVQAGGKYQIIGFGNSVNDYSTVEFPSPVMKCSVCHEQNRDAAMATAYFTNPSRAACGSCHDNVNFATGENHVNLPQISDNQCKNCHIPQGELDFDASILGAHVVPQESSLLSGLQWKIVKVDNGSAGKSPTVTFTLQDIHGNPLPLSAMNRIALTLAGPTTDYTAFGHGYVQEDASKAQGDNGTYTYTFTAAIPADAKGTYAVGLEGRRVETVLGGTTQQRSIQYGITNPVMYFSVDGTPVEPRHQPAQASNCLNCHYRLALHGENRVNNIEYCEFCHNPVETDATFRPATAGPPQTIALKFLVHRIHGGEELHTQYGTDYVVYGFNGSKNDFSEVRYPPPLNECFMCHVNGSENPAPVAETEAAITTPAYPMNPMPPVTNACYGCHDSTAMLAHAQSNANQLGEACIVCHGMNAEFAATKMHADEVTVSPDQASK